MASTDIIVTNVEVSFSFEKFRVPLRLSSGPIVGCYFANVFVTAENRMGQTATGVGGIYLSDLWSFPTTLLSHTEKANCMKDVVNRLALHTREQTDFLDPFQLAKQIYTQLPFILKTVALERGYSLELPLLLGHVCYSPIDAAIHDAWGKAAGNSCYDMYSSEYLNEDLSLFLGEEWKNIYPSDFLEAVTPKTEIKIQHVVGFGDPLTEQDLNNYSVPSDQLPVALTEWIDKELVTRIKIKLRGDNVDHCFSFVSNVYHVAIKQLSRHGIATSELKLALDPNESYLNLSLLEELLERLKRNNRDCFDAIEYIEQPTPRDVSNYGFPLHKITSYKPVIMDESLDDLHKLHACIQLGWSGIALKTCKGQSHTIVAYCWAKKNNAYVTLQDLTNTGIAFIHSTVLWSRLDLSSDSLEYNSRQYTPFSFPELKAKYPDIFHAVNGKIKIEGMSGIGLY